MVHNEYFQQLTKVMNISTICKSQYTSYDGTCVTVYETSEKTRQLILKPHTRRDITMECLLQIIALCRKKKPTEINYRGFNGATKAVSKKK